MRNTMKHYRFKNSKSYTFKQKLSTIALSVFLAYLLAWIYLGYTSKETLANTINNLDKNYISMYYTDITLSGFPFSIKLSINNPKITIDPSYHAEMIGSLIEKEDSPFPKLSYKQVYSSIEKPIIITKNFTRNSYKVILPNEIISKHYFETHNPINLICKLSRYPEILVKTSSERKKATFLPNIEQININIPSYTLRKLEGDNTIIISNGIDLYIKSSKDNVYDINYTNKGIRYTHEISDIIDELSQTKYMKHFSIISPMQYEDMFHTKKYVDSGEGKTNIEANLSFFKGINQETLVELWLKELDQSDEYGSLNGYGYIKAKINKHTNQLTLENNGYFSTTLKEIWHNRWINTIDRAFQQINKGKNLDSYRDKLKVLLPNLHHYKYGILSYKLKYDGPLLNPEKSYVSLDDLRVQTDKFIIDVRRGGNFSEELDKLPMNFIIKINNSNTVMNIGLDYLHDLIDTKVHNKSDFNHKVLSNFRSFLNEVKHKDTVCKNNWNGQLKLLKGEWYLENYRLSTIQSIVLSIMSTATISSSDTHENQ
jgi:hypothetical protein